MCSWLNDKGEAGYNELYIYEWTFPTAYIILNSQH